MQHTSSNLNLRKLDYVAWFWALSLILIPLTYIFIISFMSRGEFGGIVFKFTLDNYKKIFDIGLSQLVFISFLRSVGVAALTTILCLFLGFPLAAFMVFRGGHFKSLLFFLLVIPFWTQFLIRVYAWMSLLSDNGLIAKYLGVNWLFTFNAVIIGMVYNYLPYMTMSLYVNLEKLDISLLDAASDLGGSRFKRFTHVVLPHAWPGIMAGSIMVFIPSLGEFVIPDILGGSKHALVGNILEQQFLQSRHWPFGSALSAIFILVVGLCLLTLSSLKKNKDLEELI
jgi:spermidine/putrescine transport system permease protein